MGLKEVNVFEQHVEKIVLAVAAAGAVFMGYLAIQPVKHPDLNVGPNDVENVIAGELGKMNNAMERLATVDPIINNPNYPKRYEELATGEPLPPALVQFKAPPFGPKNMAPSAVSSNPENDTFRLVTPAPVAPELLTAEARQQLVGVLPPNTLPPGSTPPPGAEAIVLQPGVSLATRDQNATLIQGYIPVGRMLAEMLKVQNPQQRIPVPGLQKAAIYRIHVQRRESTPTGWTKFTDIAPSKGSMAPTEINWESLSDAEQAISLAEAEFKQIVIPDFYVDQNGVPIQAPILSRSFPKAVETESNSINQELQKISGGAAGAIIPPPGRGGMALPPPGSPPPGPGAGAVAPMQLRTVDEIKALSVVPFDVWDDTVVPDHTYQYQVKVEFVNPTYQWKFGLQDPQMQKTPLLSTGWVLIPQPVVIHSDIAFFITGAGFSGGDTVDTRVFKMNKGKWYRGEFTSRLGTDIAGTIQLIDEKNRPSMDVNTNYTIVDVQPAGNNVHVILKDPSGNLVTRDSVADSSNIEMINLMGQAVRPVAATGPAEGTTPAVAPVTAPPPRSSTGGPPPPGSSTPRTPTSRPIRPGGPG